MATLLSSARIIDANALSQPTGVNPSSASDGTYTWSLVGQSPDGSTFVFKTTADASSPTADSNTLQAYENRSLDGKGTYIQVRATYSGRSNKDNWTINVSPSNAGSTMATFRKGNGGGH